MSHRRFFLTQVDIHLTRFSFAISTMVLAIVLSIIMARPAMPEDAVQTITCNKAAEMRETITSLGLVHLFDGLMESGKHMVQVYASERTGEWLALQIGVDGVGCVVANGWNYTPRKPNT